MAIAQEMSCSHIYMATVVAMGPAPVSVGGASPRGVVRRTQKHRVCASRGSTFSANLHKRHLTTVGELHHKTKREHTSKGN